MTLDYTKPSDSASARADRLRQSLLESPTAAAIDEATTLLGTLRDEREFVRLCDLAELVCRFRPDFAKAYKLYAQALIETGRLAAAIDLLEGAKLRFGEQHEEYDEFEGLQGRAYKQLFMDTVDFDGTFGARCIEKSVAAYRGPYERNPVRNFWQGVNLGALAHAAQRRGLARSGPSVGEYMAELLASLDSIEPKGRDQWWHATKGEAHAARGEWAAAEDALRQYIEHKDTTAFMLASTMRQLRDVWAVQSQPLGARLLQMLEAVLCTWPEPGTFVLKMQASHLVRMRELEPEDDEHLQRLVGPKGLETIQWYRTGLERAASVAAVTERLGLRVGTGFAVRAADFGVEPRGEVLLLTNFHVLNSSGLGGRSDFGNVEVVFEAVGNQALTYSVRAVVAESPLETGLDYALLRLKGETGPLKPLPVSRAIAGVDSKARVYLIGYPLGDVMQFALQDNLLTDHECEPAGKPPRPERRRVQYSARTEKGNSGSPVFDEQWECIALHHAGSLRSSQGEVSRIAALNGGNRTVEAGQGIWIGSVQDDVRARSLRLSD